MKNKKLLVLILVLLVLITVILIKAILNRPEYFKYYVDNSEILLNTKIASIKDGINAADDRAKKWHRNAKLTDVYVSFEGGKEINDRIGEISYNYSVRNLGMFSDIGIHCSVKINMRNNSIVEFTSLGGSTDTNFGGLLNIENKDIDINDAFEIAISKFGYDVFDIYQKPVVVIHVTRNRWYFDIFNTPKDGVTEKEGLFIEIDPKSKKVLNYRNKR
jgi:hypothetical protein